MPRQQDVRSNLFPLLSFKIGISSHFCINLRGLQIWGQKGSYQVQSNDCICASMNSVGVRAASCGFVTDLQPQQLWNMQAITKQIASGLQEVMVETEYSESS